MLPKNRKRGLVLSGGGGRGTYHVGVLEFLEDHCWFPEVVAGTSIGAVNGAAIASGHRAQKLKALWQSLSSRDIQKLRPCLFPSMRSFINEPTNKEIK